MGKDQLNAISRAVREGRIPRPIAVWDTAVGGWDVPDASDPETIAFLKRATARMDEAALNPSEQTLGIDPSSVAVNGLHGCCGDTKTL